MTRRKNEIPEAVNGLSLVWSRVNQAYFIVLHGIVLRVITERREAIRVFNELVANRKEVLGE